MYHVKILCQAKTVAPLKRSTIPIIYFDGFFKNLNSGKSCCPLRKNTSSMTFTHPPSTTLTLMQSISFQPPSDSSLSKLLALWILIECHPATSWGQICRVTDTLICVSLGALNGEHQANGDAGGAVQHRKDHLHPVPLGAGESHHQGINNSCDFNRHTLGLPWHQNRTGANNR